MAWAKQTGTTQVKFSDYLNPKATNAQYLSTMDIAKVEKVLKERGFSESKELFGEEALEQLRREISGEIPQEDKVCF